MCISKDSIASGVDWESVLSLGSREILGLSSVICLRLGILGLGLRVERFRIGRLRLRFGVEKLESGFEKERLGLGFEKEERLGVLSSKFF